MGVVHVWANRDSTKAKRFTHGGGPVEVVPREGVTECDGAVPLAVDQDSDDLLSLLEGPFDDHEQWRAGLSP